MPAQQNMKRYLLPILLCGALAACATVDYQPFEGRSNRYEGSGGSKIRVGGIDFWANGTPPRAYEIVGIVTSEVGSGIGDESIIRKAVAKEAVKRSGHAAIELNNNSAFAGILNLGSGIYAATGRKTMKFAIVRYL